MQVDLHITLSQTPKTGLSIYYKYVVFFLFILHGCCHIVHDSVHVVKDSTAHEMPHMRKEIVQTFMLSFLVGLAVYEYLPALLSKFLPCVY